MNPFFPLEQFVNSFVQSVNGVLIDDGSTPTECADYLFDELPLIVELKRLEESTFDAEYYRKLQALANKWFRTGRVVAFGRVKIEMRRLPPDCQRDWLRLVEQPIQRLLAKANKQIKSSRTRLNIPHAMGLVFLASDGNFSLQPADVVTLVSRVLNKRKGPQGPQIFSAIDAVTFFSLNMAVQSDTLPPSLYWMNGLRNTENRKLGDFLKHLEVKWYEFLRKELNAPIPFFDAGGMNIEKLQFVFPTVRK